jgi:hypothetical protein
MLPCVSPYLRGSERVGRSHEERCVQAPVKEEGALRRVVPWVGSGVSGAW